MLVLAREFDSVRRDDALDRFDHDGHHAPRPQANRLGVWVTARAQKGADSAAMGRNGDVGCRVGGEELSGSRRVSRWVKRGETCSDLV